MNYCIYDSNSLKYLKVKKLIGFLHAFTGCDITSCFFEQGKNKLIKTLSDDVVLQQKIQHFYDPTVNPDVLAASANDIVGQMYGSKKDCTKCIALYLLYNARTTEKRVCSLQPIRELDISRAKTLSGVYSRRPAVYDCTSHRAHLARLTPLHFVKPQELINSTFSHACVLLHLASNPATCPLARKRREFIYWSFEPDLGGE